MKFIETWANLVEIPKTILNYDAEYNLILSAPISLAHKQKTQLK